MAVRFGPLRAEVTDPESERFTAPLVLVHGLWAGAAVWRRFAGYLAHRGWRCVALERRADAELHLGAHADDLDAAIAALDAPPVVVGHDLGALLALRCAERARAVVALAPLVTPPLAAPPQALQRAGTWLTRWRGGPLSPPPLGYPLRDRTEPAALIKQVLAGELPPPSPSGVAPRAVCAVQDDPITAMPAARALADHVGAELHVLPGADHCAVLAPGWEAHVAAIHRWIIQRLGVDLLALYDESMQTE